MKRIIKSLTVLVAVLFVCLCLVGCGGKVSEKQFSKAFEEERFENVKMTMETYDGVDLKKTVYYFQDDLIRVDVYNYDAGTLTDTIHQYYQDLGDGTSDAYVYVSTTSLWTKLDEKSEVTRSYVLKYLTDFADSDINSYTYNKEYKEYVKKVDGGIVELTFDNNKIYQAMNCFKENVSGTRITFSSYGLVRGLEVPEVTE